MDSIKRKKKAKLVGKESTSLRHERSSHPDAVDPSSRRIHETFGILTLATALLIGPSLLTVQFGDGKLMGPFGQAVGSAINYLLGAAGYLIVLSHLIIALRIFASGLGIDSPIRAFTLWRERIGIALATLFSATLLHLIARPHRIHNASVGGIIGEITAEILCSLASDFGAWVLSLTGFALAVVLATNLSWARAGLALFHLLCRSLKALTVHLKESQRNFKVTLAQFIHQLRRQPGMAADQDGSATLPPPILRLDLSARTSLANLESEELLVEKDKSSKSHPTKKKDVLKDVILDQDNALPEDLEIGGGHDALSTFEPDERLAGSGNEKEIAAELDKTEIPIIQVLGHSIESPLLTPSDETVHSDTSIRPTNPPTTEQTLSNSAAAINSTITNSTAAVSTPESKETLTIVESQYQDRIPFPATEEESIHPVKRVEQTDGPGFILHGDSYQPPPLSLLEYEKKEENNIDRDAIFKQAERLVKTLADYKIMGRVTEVHPGPVITMYEFVPAPGTRISKIASLANDLAMSLAAQRVRIVAPIPGRGAVGIEVPNEKSETVYYKEIIAHDSFRKGKAFLPLALGKSIVGAPVVMDLSKMPHLLVAGATGAGKSVSINAMICSLLMKSTPEEVRMIMVDPKFLELSGYNDIPHLLLPVVTDPKKASTALRWAVNEMERRYQLLADMKVRDIVAYNRKVDKLRSEMLSSEVSPSASSSSVSAEGHQEGTTTNTPSNPVQEAIPSKIIVVRKNADGTEEPIGSTAGSPDIEQVITPEAGADTTNLIDSHESSEEDIPRRKIKGPLPRRLPYIVVVIDEFADLMMVASKDVETSVARLAQKARAAGLHVILATQRPSVDVITGLIKANFPSRIAFQVASCHDSKTILGTQGAENLLGSGDMLVLDRGAEMKRIHGAYISDQEIRRIIDWLREQGRPVYDMDILKPQEDDEEEAAVQEEFADEMYDQAVALVAETQQASISMIQRRLRVGYNRAARMVERMEREGIVSPPDGIKGREVLIQHHY